MTIREFQKKDVEDMVRIWNQVVDEGVAFPQEEDLSLEDGEKIMFSKDTFQDEIADFIKHSGKFCHLMYEL